MMRYFSIIFLFVSSLYADMGEDIDPWASPLCSLEQPVEPCDEVIHLNFVNAINRALVANRSLLAAADADYNTHLKLQYYQSEFDLKITPSGQLGVIGGGTAGTGITYGGGVDFCKKFTTGTRFTASPFLYKAADDYHSTLKLLLNQPLLRGFGSDFALAAVRAAEYNVRSSFRAMHIAKIKVILRTILGLYEVVKQEMILQFNAESYERLRGFSESAKRKEQIGLADCLDVYRAEIELKHAEDSLTIAQERLEDAYDVLREILALPMDAQLVVEVPLEYKSVCVEVDEAIRVALLNRIELDQCVDAIKESQRLSTLARKNLLPELNLVVNYNNVGRDTYFTRAWTRKRESTWGIGFSTSTDYDQISQQNLYEQSLVSMESAYRSQEQMEVSLVLEVKRSLRAVSHACKRIGLQEDQIKTAERELKLAQIKFNRGLANNFDVIQAEKTIRHARIAFFSAVVDHIVGEHTLMASMGLLTDKPVFNY